MMQRTYWILSINERNLQQANSTQYKCPIILWKGVKRSYKGTWFSQTNLNYSTKKKSSPGWRSFKVAAFSLIFSPILVPDHFWRNIFWVFFVCYATEQWSMNHKMKPDLSKHNRQLKKEAILNCIFRYSVNSRLSQKPILCSHFFIWKNAKTNTVWQV